MTVIKVTEHLVFGMFFSY